MAKPELESSSAWPQGQVLIMILYCRSQQAMPYRPDPACRLFLADPRVKNNFTFLNDWKKLKESKRKNNISQHIEIEIQGAPG